LVGLFSYPKRKLRKLVKEGEYKQAVEFGKSLEKQNPNDPDLLFIMGSIFYILKDAKSALNYFDRVLEINDYDAETLFLKANVHVFLKEYETAIDCCKKILGVDHESMEARDLLKQLENIN
jgi:tetratricopeptide (TPR) repeat protein